MARLLHLRRRAEFLRVAGTRRKWVTPGLILQAAKQLQAASQQQAASRTDAPAAVGATGDQGLAGPPRVGFTATRKIGIAVARNRARRRLRAAADQVLPLYAAPGHDYVLVARAESLTRPFAALLGDLETALRRLGVYRDRAAPPTEDGPTAAGPATGAPVDGAPAQAGG